MKRIQSKKSQFNVKKWEKERKQVEKNITLISAYPYKNYPSTQTKVNVSIYLNLALDDLRRFYKKIQSDLWLEFQNKTKFFDIFRHIKNRIKLLFNIILLKQKDI